MASGYIQPTAFQGLVVGAPARLGTAGGVSISRATNPAECAPVTPESRWFSTDAAGALQRVSTNNHPSKTQYVINFQTGYQLRMEDASGALCTSSKDPAFTGLIDLGPDATMKMNSRWPCGATSNTWTSQSAHAIINQMLQSIGVQNKTVNAEVDVTVTTAGPNTAELWVTFSKLPTGKLGLDSTCNLAPVPITLLRTGSVCELP